MPYIEVGDLRMYCVEIGTGPPLILLGGAGSSIEDPAGSWSGLAGMFAQRFQTIQVDHRGHGRTNNPAGRITFELIANDICQLIDKLKIGTAHIAGISDGGIVALHIGMTRPELVRSLVCLGANYCNDDRVNEANAAFVETLVADNQHFADEMSRRHDINKTPGYWKDLLRQLSDNLAVNPNYSIEDLARIAAPTLLLAGENDPWANAEQMATMRAAIPRSETFVLNGAGHEIHYTHPHIVGPVVLDFLRRNSR